MNAGDTRSEIINRLAGNPAFGPLTRSLVEEGASPLLKSNAIAIHVQLVKHEACDALGGCYRTRILHHSHIACTLTERNGLPDYVPRKGYHHEASQKPWPSSSNFSSPFLITRGPGRVHDESFKASSTQRK